MTPRWCERARRSPVRHGLNWWMRDPGFVRRYGGGSLLGGQRRLLSVHGTPVRRLNHRVRNMETPVRSTSGRWRDDYSPGRAPAERAVRAPGPDDQQRAAISSAEAGNHPADGNSAACRTRVLSCPRRTQRLAILASHPSPGTRPHRTTVFGPGRGPLRRRMVHGVQSLMPKRMLIDATHAEETRVVVWTEAASKILTLGPREAQLKGNIYLAGSCGGTQPAGLL